MPTDLSSSTARDTAVRPLQSAIFLGGGTGVLGLCLGGAVGILRSAHPGLAAAYTGVQFFVLGGSASLTRDAVLTALPTNSTRNAEIIASTTAGVVSGAAAGRFWGRLTFVPGGLLVGILGFSAQRYLHYREDIPRDERDHRTIMQRFADSNWSPLRNLSNDEYHKVLTERLTKLDAEINVVEQRLRDLRQLESQTSGK